MKPGSNSSSWRERIVLSLLAILLSMDMTTQLDMMVMMISHSKGGQVTNQTKSRLEDSVVRLFSAVTVWIPNSKLEWRLACPLSSHNLNFTRWDYHDVPPTQPGTEQAGLIWGVGNNVINWDEISQSVVASSDPVTEQALPSLMRLDWKYNQVASLNLILSQFKKRIRTENFLQNTCSERSCIV